MPARAPTQRTDWVTDSRQAWLASLAPRVRAEVEAEIAYYEDPDNAEYMDMDDDWQPSPNAAFTVVPDRPPGVLFDVEFSHSECEALLRAVGDGDPFQFIRAAALDRAREINAAEQGQVDADTVTAAD